MQPDLTNYKPGDVITLPHYATAGGPARKRVWKVSAVYLGGTYQEGVYELSTLDYSPTDMGTLLVPCLLLESNPHVQRV